MNFGQAANLDGPSIRKEDAEAKNNPGKKEKK